MLLVMPWLTFEIKNQRDLEQHQTIFNCNFYQPMLKSLIKASSLATQRHPQKSESSSMILINEYNKCVIKLIIWTTGWFWMLNSRDSVKLVLHKWIVYKKALRNVQKFIKTGWDGNPWHQNNWTPGFFDSGNGTQVNWRYLFKENFGELKTIKNFTNLA